MDTDRRKWEFIKDIVVPVIMGVCSIAVAISANRIAKSSSEAAKLQALIAKNAEAPTIELVYMVEGYENNDCIKISILDGKYSNFASETVSFLSFGFREAGEDSEWGSYRMDIPINYFLSGAGRQALYGEIWELRSKFTAEIELLCDSLKEYYTDMYSPGSETPHWLTPSISVLTCLKCTYLNLLEEEETVYYTMGLSQPVSQIRHEQGEEWFQKYEDMRKDGFFLYSETVEQNDVKAVSRLIDAIKAGGPQYIDMGDTDE